MQYKRLLSVFRRSYRKMFHKDWDVMSKGLELFTEFANIYGESINYIKDADRFFVDFMNETKGEVIVDFLDSDNWDCIEDVKFDHEKGLIYLLFRQPLTDPEERAMRKIVFPFDTYGIILKFSNIRFVHDKNQKYFAVVINGYTLKDNEINEFIASDDCDKFKKDDNSSFFSTDFIREKGGLTESMRIIKTPITSFWIIPKMLPLHPQDSEKLLYLYNLDKLEKQIKQSFEKLNKEVKNQMSKEAKDDTIKTSGHKMRRVAEGLFKLIMCFYQKEFGFKPQSYNKRLLGDAISPLKKSIYESDVNKDHLGTIARIANDLSHETGNPVTMTDVVELYVWLNYFISDFRNRISRKGNNLLKIEEEKPSPSSFIQGNLLKWNFADEINKSIISEPDNCAFKITIRSSFSNTSWLSADDDYLCKDGMIRKLPENDESSVLIITNRNDVIALIESIYKKIMEECANEGLDEELVYMEVEITNHYMRKGLPTHLFTFEEIKDLMSSANDNVNNKLVIDENGYAKIVQNPFGGLYPVSQETWHAGNNYVGKHSDLSDAKPSYHLCLKGWLSYLKTGVPYYADYYQFIENENSIIEEIKKYY